MSHVISIGVILSVFILSVTCDTQIDRNNDHLLKILDAMHKSHSFHSLPSSEQVLLVELIAAAEVDQITHLIDRVGFSRIATFLDHVTKIDQNEAHALEHYLMQELNQEAVNPTKSTVHQRKVRSLQSQIERVMQSHLYTSLSPQDQQLILDLLVASNNHNVTQLVQAVGYASIIGLVEHISSPSETHVFLTFLVRHMDAEAANHHPIVG